MHERKKDGAHAPSMTANRKLNQFGASNVALFVARLQDAT